MSALQREVQRAHGRRSAEDLRSEAERSVRGPGGPLPHLNTLQRAFGRHDLSHVVSHHDRVATLGTQRMGAEAFTFGDQVAFAQRPGLYTAAHEAAHVVQQRAGLRPAGGVGRPGDLLERQADAVADAVVRGESVEGMLGEPGANGPAGPPAVQMKGAAPLTRQLPDLESLPGGHRVERLRIALLRYDASTDVRPEDDLKAISMIYAIANRWLEKLTRQDVTPAVNAVVGALDRVLKAEQATLKAQMQERVDKYTKDDDAPYEQMTDEGLLWTHPDYAHNTTRERAHGKAYFEKLSKANMHEMLVEAGGELIGEQSAEFMTVQKNAETALKGAVLRHYTTQGRATQMLTGGMKSKMMLQKGSTEVRHNTQGYDEHALANTGFVFYFIEPASTPFRDTRFSQAEAGEAASSPARITLPIAESGLLERGWVMLSDFMERDYRSIRTDADASRVQSFKESRRPATAQRLAEPMREFRYGLGEFPDDDEIPFELIDGDRRDAYAAATAQVRGDATSAQVYGGGKHDVPDRLLNNVLVGKDIIEGMALRTAMEFARLKRVKPALAEQLKTKQGDDLLGFITKELLSPQAMIPNSVAIEPKHLEVKP